MKKSIKRKQEHELKIQRQERIDKNIKAKEVENIEKNLKIHSFLYSMIKIMRILNGYKLNVNQTIKDISDRPIIIAPNHVRKQDIEIIMEAIPFHMFLLSGDFINVHGTVSGAMLEKNGIVYFDMEDKKDRNNVKKIIKEVLDNNINLLWFYEGSWNLSPNKPYYDGNYFIVQAAIDSNALVLPVSFDMIGNEAYVEVGNFIDFRKKYGCRLLSDDEKKEALDKIKGQIGCGLFNIWERQGITRRKEIPINYWEEYKKEVLSEWYFNEQDIDRKHFQDKKYVSNEDAFKHLKTIKLTKNNAFLFSKRNHN